MAPIPVITKVFAFKLVPPSSVICVFSIRQKRMPRPLLQAQKSSAVILPEKSENGKKQPRNTLWKVCKDRFYILCKQRIFSPPDPTVCRMPSPARDPGPACRNPGGYRWHAAVFQYFQYSKNTDVRQYPRIFLLIYIGNHPGRRALSAEMLPRQLSLCRKIAYTRNTPGRVSCFVACVQTARRMFQINVPCLEGGPTDA